MCPHRSLITRSRKPGTADGFTLVELIVVITIILLVSAAALPTVLPALRHRQVSEGSRILQGALVGARDSAIKNNAPSGIRLLPDPGFPLVRRVDGRLDPAQPLAASAIVPIAPAPGYGEGAVSTYPGSAYGAAVFGALPANALVLEESVGTWTQSGASWTYLPNAPTSWWWNIRVGDKVRLDGAGVIYTVIGPLGLTPATGNNEWFANVGTPGSANPLSRTLTAPDNTTQVTVSPEYLLLVNGLDDNKNGYVDEEFDGVDNDGDGLVDNPTEWLEAEGWQGAAASGLVNRPYTITRRAAPAPDARQTVLPSQVVIDLTTASGTRERSRVPVDPYTGYVDVLMYPDGRVVPSPLYSSPSSTGMDAAFLHFWVAERVDVNAASGATVPTLAAPSGEYALVSVFARTGQVATMAQPPITNPFAAIQQGAR